MKFKRILLKLSGEALMGDCPERPSQAAEGAGISGEV